MEHKLRYASMALISSAALSSCGLLGTFQSRTQSHRGSNTSQTLLVSSLGATEKDGSISSYRLDPGSLSVTLTGKLSTPSPTFLSLDQAGEVLYVTNETTEEATASAFGFNAETGVLTPINSSLILGESPTYISSYDDKVVTANYGSGTITLMNRDASGALGQADWRIELGNKGVSHPHAAVFSPDGKDLFVSDLGLDRVFHFNISKDVPPITIDDAGVRLQEGTGPRHLIFGKNGDYVYLLAEKSPKIFVFRKRGAELSQVQELSTGTKSTGAHIAISPDGRYLYTSFRSGGDGIMVHSIATDGKLTYVGFTPTDKHPRQFAISPDGRFIAVAARDGGSVTFFERDSNFGTLRATGVSIPISRPVFVLWE